MNTAFQYPPSVAPTPRARPRYQDAPAASSTNTTKNLQPNRDSNALRASVLDVALQLGLGTNGTVADWIFNNPLEEEEENPRSPLTPGLTNNDTTGSDDSYHYPSTPPAAILPPHKVGHTLDNGFITIPKEGTQYIDDQRDNKKSAAGTVGFQENLPPPPSVAPSTKGKLRKKKGDGYESDAGYMSEGAPKSKKEKKEEMKRKKSKKQTQDENAPGYDTDFTPEKGLSKSKTKKAKKASGDAGYETDGYTSTASKKKSRFFGLRSKQPKPEPRQEISLELPPPVVMEPIVLPIASMFASTAPPPSPSPSAATTTTMNTSPGTSMARPSESSLRPPTSPPSSFPVSSPSAIMQSLAAASPTPTPSSRWSVTPSEVPTELAPPSIQSQPTKRESLASLESSESHAASSTSSHMMSRIRRISSSLGHGSSSVGHGSSSVGHGSPVTHDYSPLHPSQTRTPSRPPSRPGTADSHGSRPTSPSSTRPYPAISLPLTHKPSLNHKTSFTGRYPTPGNNSPPVSAEAFGNVPTVENTQSVLYHHGIPPSPNTASPMTPSYPPSAMSNTSNRIPSRAPSPSSRLGIPAHPYLGPPSPGGLPPNPSPVPSPRLRPRNPPTDGFGPRGQSVSPLPSPGIGQLAVPPSLQPRGQTLQVVTDGLAPPSRGNSRAPSPMIFPSEDFVVPSPSFPPPSHPSQQAPLPSPHVLAYYDIPPPSPPPSGPLPSVPPPGSYQRHRERERTLSNGSSNNGHNGPSPLGRLARQTSNGKLATAYSEQGLNPQPNAMQRGKESPFPARPILPLNTSKTSPTNSIDDGKPAPAASGLEAKLRVPRYRELYALALPEGPGFQERRKAFERMGGDEVERFEQELNKGRNSAQSLDDEDMDEAEMQDVLARFKESRISHEIELGQQNALGRSQSTKALYRKPSNATEHRRLESAEVAGLPEISDEEDDEPMAVPTRRPPKATNPDSDSDSDSDRNSRWTESLYSRASFLDPEKSEEARDQFIRRVEEMYNESGREREAVPPVPKLPAAYAAETSTPNAATKERSWRF